MPTSTLPQCRNLQSGLIITQSPDGSVATASSYLVINTTRAGSSLVCQAGK